MWIDRLLANPTNDALSLSMQFSEARQRVLAENVANIDTPDYSTKSLDLGTFQDALRESLEQAGAGQPLRLREGPQFSMDASGALRTQPTADVAPNVLFHDGTNARLEDLMSDAAGNGLQYEFASNLLRAKFEQLQLAIRGRVQ